MTKEDARIAAVLGWPSLCPMRRAKTGGILVSWFPVDSSCIVLYNGANSAPVDRFVPMSLALEEEYRQLPPKIGSVGFKPYRGIDPK